MNETDKVFEEITEPQTSTVAAPLGTGSSVTGAVVAAAEEVVTRIGYQRWTICALLFFATTINYIDRMVLGFLAPDLQRSIGWNEEQYGWIVTAFTAAYAIGLLVVGKFMDWLGTRKGFSISVVVWSLAAMGHAFANTALGFGVARFALGRRHRRNGGRNRRNAFRLWNRLYFAANQQQLYSNFYRLRLCVSGGFIDYALARAEARTRQSQRSLIFFVHR